MLGIGEGAVVDSQDIARIAEIRSFANFGFEGTRDSQTPGVNAKISEYTAAVGLAALAEWPQKRAALKSVVDGYNKALKGAANVTLAPGFLNGAARSTCDVLFSDVTAANAMRVLADKGVETRQWWSQGCHTARAYSECPRGDLPVTEQFGRHVLGLPLSVDLTGADISRICDAVVVAANG